MTARRPRSSVQIVRKTRRNKTAWLRQASPAPERASVGARARACGSLHPPPLVKKVSGACLKYPAKPRLREKFPDQVAAEQRADRERRANREGGQSVSGGQAVNKARGMVMANQQGRFLNTAHRCALQNTALRALPGGTFGCRHWAVGGIFDRSSSPGSDATAAKALLPALGARQSP